ncbi:Uncharacterised protein [Ectopseudomonas mendocina]|uniref:Uncharacterized protein n=2 Tax=Ectopseudomonas mendocina TaxID=300 RepID=A0A379PN12_ECTME|nr:Uncharacterised protein [Pseudomonas mendocina]
MHPAMHVWAVIAASLSTLHYHFIVLSNGKWVYEKVDAVDPLVVFTRQEFVSLRHCIRLFCREVGLDEPFQYHLEDSNHVSSRNVEGFATWS